MDDLVPEFGRRTAPKRAGEVAAAAAVLPLLLELVPDVESVVQVGFGDGAWLAEARRLGVRDVHGIDGPWAALDGLVVPADWVTLVDTRLPFGGDGRSYDLAICLEYAEHLPDSRAASLAADLAALAPVVAFSGAIPGQGGSGHVNEQWPAYWEAHFAAVGYRLVDAVRYRLWDAPGMPAYLAQNLLLAVEERRLPDYPRLVDAAGRRRGAALSLVHPQIYDAKTHLTEPSIRVSATLLRRAVLRRARRLRGD